jgi:methionyl-tRNA synthetase
MATTRRCAPAYDVAMPESRSSFYLTTPIYYVNDAPHIGHAYTTVAADVLTRWHRQRQEQVWFLTGTDEHGQKVMRTAEANGVSPQAWADRLVEDAWKPLLATLDVRNDDFIRTTQDRHTTRVQTFIQDLYDKGEIYAGQYEGYYSVRSEEFVPANEIADGTGADEGRKVSTRTGEPLEWVSEQNYFFRMSAYTERLLAFYEENPTFVQPASARNEVLAFVRQGLQDLSVSRNTFDWGIPIPWDTSHVLYVWFDALLNYATAVGLGSDDPDEKARFERTWPADVHLVGKDILRFHAVIWPAMLMAAGLPLPGQVFAHGWLLVGGEKMSKSKLNGIVPSQIIDTFGSDAFRYYFLRAIVFGQDGSFSWEDLSARYQAELANGFGNLASRVTAMIAKNFGGRLPETGPLTPAEDALAAVAARAVSDAQEAIDRLALNEAINAVWTLVDATNLYLTEQEPWKVAKAPDEVGPDGLGVAGGRLATILGTAAEALRALAVLLHPVMPQATSALWTSLGAEPALGPIGEQQIADAGVFGRLPAGTVVTKGASLFPRIEEPAEQ